MKRNDASSRARKGTELSRRRAVGLAAGAALLAATGERWVFAVGDDGDVVKTAGDASAWRPILFNEREAEGLARVVDALIPRTTTPGARDARVHEYIDLAVSVAPVEDKKKFVDGFRWLDRRAKKTHGKELADLADADLVALLRTISDEQKDPPKALAVGSEFFVELKKRTIFGYYTSREGRVQELGLPETVSLQQWQGCPHPDGEHTT